LLTSHPGQIKVVEADLQEALRQVRCATMDMTLGCTDSSTKTLDNLPALLTGHHHFLVDPISIV